MDPNSPPFKSPLTPNLASSRATRVVHFCKFARDTRQELKGDGQQKRIRFRISPSVYSVNQPYDKMKGFRRLSMINGHLTATITGVVGGASLLYNNHTSASPVADPIADPGPNSCLFSSRQVKLVDADLKVCVHAYTFTYISAHMRM